jgi:hypothetical protein
VPSRRDLPTLQPAVEAPDDEGDQFGSQPTTQAGKTASDLFFVVKREPPVTGRGGKPAAPVAHACAPQSAAPFVPGQPGAS